jgi:hypothetical protein
METEPRSESEEQPDVPAEDGPLSDAEIEEEIADSDEYLERGLREWGHKE